MDWCPDNEHIFLSMSPASAARPNKWTASEKTNAVVKTISSSARKASKSKESKGRTRLAVSCQIASDIATSLSNMNALR
eukprot:3867082-Amphidinium_carterae.1